MSEGRKIGYFLILKALMIWLVVSLVAVLLFATVMFFLEGGYEYSPLFATVSIAAGCFVTAMYLGNALSKKGILIGLAVGGITFALVTLVTLLINSGSVSIHIFLRLVILLLASIIGGIIGVNRKAEQKYI